MDEAPKIDFYPRELIPGELERSEMLELFTGVSLPIVSKVDAVGSKLIWISKGSHKSRRDVRHIYRRASADECQQIRQLSEQLRLQELLDEVLHEPDEIENS